MPTSSGGSSASSGAMTQLSSTTLGADGTFDITGISSAYNDLIVVLIGRDSAAGSASAQPEVKLNNDATANYYNERYTATAASLASAEGISAGFLNLGNLPGGLATANFFGTIEATLFGYASTARVKTCHARSFYPVAASTGGVNIRDVCGIWNSTAAISRITITGTGAGNLLAGSQLRIYGRL